MRLIGVVITTIVMLMAGCTSQPTQQQKDYLAYIDSERPKAERGEIKWTDYYVGLYNKAVVANPPPYYLPGVSELIKAAQRLERGEMSMEDFQNFRRDQIAMFNANAAAYAQARHAQQQAEQQTALQNMAATLQIMNAMQPQPMLVSPTGGAPLRMQNVQGNFRYCTYNNNVVVTVRLPGSCPAYQ